MKRIKLSDKEVEYLRTLVKKGRKSTRELTRARILLLINEGRTEIKTKEILGISRATPEQPFLTSRKDTRRKDFKVL